MADVLLTGRPDMSPGIDRGLLKVVVEGVGTGLLGAHVVGATVLAVAAGGFRSAGQCRVGDDVTVYTYTRVDDSLAIDPPLVVAAEDGEPVESLTPTGAVETTLIAVVDLDMDGDPKNDVRATISGDLAPYYPLGDSAAGAMVSVKHTHYGYEVAGRPNDAPTFDGAYITPGTVPSAALPPPTDGLVPSSSPAVTVTPLGVGGLLASWAPTVNADPVNYNVYVSLATIPDPADPATLLPVSPVTATQVALSVMPDGSAIPRGVPVYVRVRALDDDGPAVALGVEGVGSSRLATTADVAADFVYAGQVESQQVRTGDLNAVLAVLGGLTVGNLADKHIILNPTTGFQLVAADGTVLVHFPIAPDSINRFQGDLVAQGFTALGAAQFRGVDNEISVNSVFTLASGVTKPANYPSISTDYTEVVPGMALSGGVWAGYNQGTWWDGTEYSALNWYPADKIQRYNPTTATLVALTITYLFPSEPRQGQRGMTKIGTSYYLKYDAINGAAVYERWIGKFNSSGVETARMKYDPYSYTLGSTSGPAANDIALDTDGTNLLVGQVNPADGKLRVQAFSAALTGAPISTWTSSTALAGVGDTTIASLLYGSFDYGSTRYVARAVGSKTLYSFTTAGAEQASERWDYPQGATDTFDTIWDGTRFQTMSADGPRKMSTDRSTDTITAAYSWYDSDTGGTGTHETQVGPVATATRKPRYGVQFNVSTMPADAGDPDSPDSARIYAKQGAYSTTADLDLQVSDAGNQGRISTALDAIDTGAPPPTANTFPDGVASQLKSQLGGFIVKGDGTGDWPYFRTQYLDPAVAPLAPKASPTFTGTVNGLTAGTGSVGTGTFRDSVDARADARIASIVGTVTRGTWTPTLLGTTVAGSHTYTSRAGYYQQVGGMVTINAAIRIDTRDAAMSGNLRIGGLPIAPSVMEGFTPGPINYNLFTLGTGYTQVWAKIFNTTQLALTATGSNVAEKYLTAADIPAGAILLSFSMTYLAVNASWGG